LKRCEGEHADNSARLEEWKGTANKEEHWLRALEYEISSGFRHSTVSVSVLEARLQEMIAAKKLEFVITEEDITKGFCSICGE
jgi:hypothetical protein